MKPNAISSLGKYRSDKETQYRTAAHVELEMKPFTTAQLYRRCSQFSLKLIQRSLERVFLLSRKQTAHNPMMRKRRALTENSETFCFAWVPRWIPPAAHLVDFLWRRMRSFFRLLTRTGQERRWETSPASPVPHWLVLAAHDYTVWQTKTLYKQQLELVWWPYVYVCESARTVSSHTETGSEVASASEGAINAHAQNTHAQLSLWRWPRLHTGARQIWGAGTWTLKLPQRLAWNPGVAK